ncbi:MAG: hypothetical protein PHR26_03520 [Candidatus ainarchaeum sp.]|nr:hypothetical protein [Candidatus ainarchaeum sp.]MDD3975612.1 hypothetical protein [Candidatus ainarchaeum sp.]
MIIYFLEQNEKDSNKFVNIIFTDNLADFFTCEDIYKKYYSNYNLPFRDIDIMGINDFEDYINKKYLSGSD